MQTSHAFGKIPAILAFPFKGEGWFGKLAIAALLLLAGAIIPIVPTIFLLGYAAEIIRRITVEKEDASMPPWDDWGKLFNDGVKMLGASLIVVLPIMLIFIVLAALYIIPFAIIGMDGGEEAAAGFFFLIFFIQMILIFVSVIVSVIAGLFQPVYMTHMINKNQFSAIFKVNEWWHIFKAAFWEFVVSFLLLGSLYMVVMYATMLLIYSVICCCLSPFIGTGLMAYMLLVYVALMAYAYRSGAEKVGVDAEKPAPKPEASPSSFDLPAGPAKIVEPSPQTFTAEALPAAESAPEPEAIVVPSAVEPPAEMTMVSAAFAEEPEECDLLEIPAAEATLINQILARDEVAVAEQLFAGQSTVKLDDLKKISGIGPKTAAALNKAGILTYQQLADIPLDTLKQILNDAGLEVLLPQCGTWPQKAKEMLK